MYSQTQFSPGNKSNSRRIITYVAEHNARFPNSSQLKSMTKRVSGQIPHLQELVIIQEFHK